MQSCTKFAFLEILVAFESFLNAILESFQLLVRRAVIVRERSISSNVLIARTFNQIFTIVDFPKLERINLK